MASTRSWKGYGGARSGCGFFPCLTKKLPRSSRYEGAAVAHRLVAPVIKTLPGKAVIPDDSALSVGGIGLLGTRPAEELVDDWDVLLMVGTNFPYTKHLPKPGAVRMV